MIRRAVTDTEKGMGSYDAEITEEAVDFLADMSEGDARHALNAVELVDRAESGDGEDCDRSSCGGGVHSAALHTI